jgi:DME family drug/metabolite transporter
VQVRKSSLFVLSAGFLFGTAGTAVALGPSGVSGFSAGFSRLLLGAIFLLLVIPLFGGNWSRTFLLIKNPAVWVMGATAGLYQPLFFGATQRAGVALSTLITVGSAPIFAGLIGRIFIKEKLNSLWIISTLIAIFGLTLRSINEISNVDTIGIFMAVGAGFAIGTYTSAAKVALKKGGNAIELPAISYLIGTLVLSPFLIGQDFDWLFTPNGIVMALYLGLITMALANVLYVLGLRELSAGPTATLLLADPLTATLLGFFVLNESITALGWIGIVLVSAALVLQSMARESDLLNGISSPSPRKLWFISQ